mgnify:CR=1 FL=1
MNNYGPSNTFRQLNKGTDYIQNSYNLSDGVTKITPNLIFKGVVIDVDFGVLKSTTLASFTPPFSVFAKIIGMDDDVFDPTNQQTKTYYPPLFPMHTICIPEIGEGWVSETELYYLLKGEFYNEEVIHHGKPKWLGRQHVDIWFPKHKIGIEYQGLQHDQPVEFFGGEEGFIEGQKRDKRKKKLFKENNSILIEVREGYSIEDVVNEIKKNIT